MGSLIHLVFYILVSLQLTSCVLSDFSIKEATPITDTDSDSDSDSDVPEDLKLSINYEDATVEIEENSLVQLVIVSDRAAPKNIKINWVISEGAEADFVSTSGSLYLEKNKKALSISLTTKNNIIYQGNRNYTLNISGEDGLVQNDLSISLVIKEDDPQYLVKFVDSSYSVNESLGNFLLPVELNQAYPSDISVQYTISGTTIPGVDYLILNSGTLVIPSGQTQANISIDITDDSFVEGTERISFSLSGTDQENVVIQSLANTTYVDIIDNDLSISPKSATLLSGDTLNIIVNGGDGNYTYSLVGATISTISPSGVITTGNTDETFTVNVTDGAGAAVQSSVEVVNIAANSQLKLWLKADSLSLADGSQVASWADQTTNGNDFSQATSSRRPLWIANGLNGKPVLRFDGTDDFLSSSFLPATGANPRSVTMVINNLDYKNGSSDSVVFSWGGTTTHFNAFGFNAISPATGSRFANAFSIYSNNNGSYRSFPTSPSADKSYVVTVNYNGSVAKLFVNSKEIATLSLTLNTTSVNNMRIGSRFSTGYFKGDLAEMALYDDILSVSDQAKLECYLSRKYNIPLLISNSCGHLTLSTKLDGNLTLQENETYQLDPSGGQPPYQYSVISGTSTINSSGLITAAMGAGNSVVRVTDSSGQTSDLNLYVVNYTKPKTWLNLSAISNTITHDEKVSYIPDISGNDIHFTQRHPTYQPTYKINILNNQPSLNFSGGQFLSVPYYPPSGAGARTFIFVTHGALSGNLLDYGDSYQCDNKFRLHYSSTNQRLEMDRQCSSTNSSVTTTESRIIVAEYNGTHVRLYENGSLIGSGGVTLATSLIYGLKIGSHREGESEYLTGNILEFMSFDSVLTEPNRSAIQTYLATKYNITLNP